MKRKGTTAADKLIPKGPYAFEAKLRSTCSCVYCGFTERLSNELVSEMLRQTAGCPVHGDGSWPPADQIERWLVQDYIDFIEAFLAWDLDIDLFLREFMLQFEDQADTFAPEPLKPLFELYSHVDGFFVARRQCEQSANRSLRRAAKLTRDRLRSTGLPETAR